MAALFPSPYNKDHHVLGSILGPLMFGNSPLELQGKSCRQPWSCGPVLLDGSACFRGSGCFGFGLLERLVNVSRQEAPGPARKFTFFA